MNRNSKTVTELSNIHQGHLLDKNRFIVLICDIDDIKGKAKDMGLKLSKKEVQEAFEYAQRKLSDLTMDQFWEGIEACIDEVKN